MQHECSFCGSTFECGKTEDEHTKYELQEAILFCGEECCEEHTYEYSPWMIHSKEEE